VDVRKLQQIFGTVSEQYDAYESIGIFMPKKDSVYKSWMKKLSRDDVPVSTRAFELIHVL
jgi:hypothetical protein